MRSVRIQRRVHGDDWPPLLFFHQSYGCILDIFFHNSHYSILIVLPYHFLRNIVLLSYVLYLRQCAVNEIEFENIHYHYNGS